MGDRRAATFVLIDVPFAAVRRHVGMNEVPPPQVDALIATVFEAVVGGDVAT